MGKKHTGKDLVFVLNVGFISAWHVHTDGYADEMEKSGTVNICAMWDEDPVRGAEWAKRRGAEFIADYDAFLARTDFTAVVCNSPTTMHPQLLGKAAQAGKHIFTEKLLATSTGECAKLAKAIVDSGVTFTISLPLRTDAKMLYAKRLVDEGALGRISGARMRRSHSGVSDGWLPEYWFDLSKTGGGAMMDLGAHPAYLLPFFFGAPKRISGMTSNLYGTSGDENAFSLMEFENGVIASGETAFVTHGVPDLLEIYGSEGSLFIHGNEIRLATKKETKNFTADELPAGRPSPVLQFVDACLQGTGTPAYLGVEDALVVTKVIEATYSSDRDGAVVSLS